MLYPRDLWLNAGSLEVDLFDVPPTEASLTFCYGFWVLCMCYACVCACARPGTITEDKNVQQGSCRWCVPVCMVHIIRTNHSAELVQLY